MGVQTLKASNGILTMAAGFINLEFTGIRGITTCHTPKQVKQNVTNNLVNARWCGLFCVALKLIIHEILTGCPLYLTTE